MLPMKMSPERLAECLHVVRWNGSTLAEAVDVSLLSVGHWLAGSEPVPEKVAAWLEALCFVHEAAEKSKPATAGAGFVPDALRAEHVPVYSYHLLRALGEGAIPLRRLFGTSDEGAVFFLVSRGLAARIGSDLAITAAGLSVGEIDRTAASMSLQRADQ
jgi:hypothetical protein